MLILAFALFCLNAFSPFLSSFEKLLLLLCKRILLNLNFFIQWSLEIMTEGHYFFPDLIWYLSRYLLLILYLLQFEINLFLCIKVRRLFKKVLHVLYIVCEKWRRLFLKIELITQIECTEGAFKKSSLASLLM